MSDKLEFRVSSALKNIVGKDLIVNDYIAIFELVKNSFDARATHVTIIFGDNSIIIADNGKGMTLDDIKNKWLFLAFSAKKDGNEDLPKEDNYRDKIHERRFYAGAKGIGRFSSDRLGQELTLTTKTNENINCEQIFVDWTNFEKDQAKEFVEISVDHTSFLHATSTNIFPNESPQGTILKIDKLNDDWPSIKLRNLRRSLEKLINPFSGENSFSIEIICKRELEEDKSRAEGEKINGILKNTILDALNQKTTQIDVTISSTDIITEIKDRGINIYKIKEPNFNSILTGTSISLLFLNRSAKHTFTSRMGIQSLDYGSVFLYKNGFRIYPYGEPEDDSWGIDARKQQGYNRYLGSRDLIGKVEIYTNYNDEFKETSSRDGGLVQTNGAILLNKAFEKAHRRLERYVVGVLWGEGFKKREFFINDEIADEYRKRLAQDKDLDKMSDIIKSNLGSKLDFTQIIKGLAKEKDVEILEYNEELTRFIAEELDTATVKIDVLKDVEEIAIKTGNEELMHEIEKISIALNEEIAKREKAQRDSEEAERRLLREIAKREEAQRKANEAEKARNIAEENRRKEEIAKKEAELKRKEAEQKTKEKELELKEEKLKKEEAERKQKHAEAQKAEADNKLEIEKDKNTYLSATRHLTKEVEDIIHTIKISSNELKSSAKNIRSQIINNKENRGILEDLVHISFHIDRINKLSSLLTKADISFLKEHVKLDIPSYVEEYIQNYSVSIPNMKFTKNFNEPFIRKISSLDLSVILDNLISNSKKAGANEILVDFSKEGSHLHIDFSDNGDGVPDNLIKNDSLFEVGVTNRRGGSGIGLSVIKERLNKNLYSDIIFVGNNQKLKGATFRIIF